MAGHAAVQRCAAFRGWDEREAQNTVQSRLQDFMRDIKDVVLEDVVPGLNLEFGERIKEGISRAIDKTGEVMDSFVRQPAVAAGRGVATTGARVTGAISRAAGSVLRGAAAGGRAASGWTAGTCAAAGRGVLRGSAAGLRGAKTASTALGRGVAAACGKAVRFGRPAKGPRDKDKSKRPVESVID
jgi:hypothetical protein